jgi:hypothetical protein
MDKKITAPVSRKKLNYISFPNFRMVSRVSLSDKNSMKGISIFSTSGPKFTYTIRNILVSTSHSVPALQTLPG